MRINSTASKAADLHESIQAILAYEEAYRLAQLGLERMLWLCRSLPGGFVREEHFRHDAVLKLIADRFAQPVRRLTRTLDSATNELHHESHRLNDVRQFLEVASECEPVALARTIMERHADVQRGKFDRGRRKMPWLEESAGRISLTMVRVGGLKFEATEPTKIPPHPYRLGAADALIRAAGGP